MVLDFGNLGCLSTSSVMLSLPDGTLSKWLCGVFDTNMLRSPTRKKTKKRKKDNVRIFYTGVNMSPLAMY